MKGRQTSKAGTDVGDGTVERCLRAGVAKSDITTRRKGILIKDPLYAKVLVLDDGTTKMAIIAMDVTEIGCTGDVSDDFLPKLRNRIQRELKISGRNVLVNASHVHLPGRPLRNDVEQVDRTFDAVRRAVQNMTPVKVGAGRGREDRITVNRTLRLKNGKDWTIRHANPCPPDEEVAGVGPIDPEIGILRVDRTDGRPLAVVYNFACHPLFGDPRGAISANFPAFASKVIEENLGHDAMALFLQGAGGDVIDVFFKDFNRARDTESLGTMLGLSTLKALKTIRSGDAKLRVISETIKLPRRTDIRERIEELRQEQTELCESLRLTSLNFKSFLPLYIKYTLNPDYPADYSYRYLQEEKTGVDHLSRMDSHNKGCIRKYLENIYAMERLTRIQDRIDTFEFYKSLNDAAGEPTIRAEVQGLRVGDFVLITSPAEVLVEVALNVKKASPHKYTFVASCSNGCVFYSPPAEAYSRGGYEVTACLLAPEWQRIYEKKANEIIRAL